MDCDGFRASIIYNTYTLHYLFYGFLGVYIQLALYIYTSEAGYPDKVKTVQDNVILGVL